MEDSNTGSLIPESLSEEHSPPFPQMSFSQTLTLVPIFKKTGVGMNGDEAQAVGEDLLLDDGRVVVHQDLLHSQPEVSAAHGGGYFGNGQGAGIQLGVPVGLHLKGIGPSAHGDFRATCPGEFRNNRCIYDYF